MTKYIHRAGGLLLFAFLLLCFFQPKTALASEVTHVTDDAAIFTDTEREDLETQCISVSEKNSIDVIILTITGTDLTRKQYLEDYYDSQDTVLSDAVLLLLNMDPDDRGIEIQGYGSCEYSVSDDRVESIIDDIYSDLKDGAYYDAMQLFLEDVDYYVNLAPTSTYQHTEQDNQNYNENYYEDYQNADKPVDVVGISLRNLLIAVVIGGVTVFIMAYNSGGRMTASQSAYLDSSHSRILGKYDRYINTTTTRRQKPKPPPDSGSGFGGGGGVSSGGHSHSGGGRSF